MDAARTALRMGAGKVYVLFRRTMDQMSALQTEYNEAIEEGVEFLWETTVTEFIGSNGKLEKIRVKTPEGENFMPIDRIAYSIQSIKNYAF